MSRAVERGAHTSTSSAKMRRIGTWLPPESVAVPGLSPPCGLRFFRFFRSSHRPFAALSFSRSNRCSALGIRVATAVTAAAPALCLPKRSASSSPPQSSFFSLLSQTRFLRLVSSPLPAYTFSLTLFASPQTFLSPDLQLPDLLAHHLPLEFGRCHAFRCYVRPLASRPRQIPASTTHKKKSLATHSTFCLPRTIGSRPHSLVNVRVASSFSNTTW